MIAFQRFEDKTKMEKKLLLERALCLVLFSGLEKKVKLIHFQLLSAFRREIMSREGKG